MARQISVREKIRGQATTTTLDVIAYFQRDADDYDVWNDPDSQVHEAFSEVHYLVEQAIEKCIAADRKARKAGA